MSEEFSPFQFFKKPWKLRLNIDDTRTPEDKKQHLMIVLRNVRKHGTMEEVGAMHSYPRQRIYRDPFLFRNKNSSVSVWENFEDEYYAWHGRRMSAAADRKLKGSNKFEHPHHYEHRGHLSRDEDGHFLKIVELENDEGNDQPEGIGEADVCDTKRKEFVDFVGIRRIEDSDELDESDNTYAERSGNTSFDNSTAGSSSDSCEDISSNEDNSLFEDQEDIESLRPSSPFNNTCHSSVSTKSANSTINVSAVNRNSPKLRVLWNRLRNEPLRVYYTLWHCKSTLKKGSKQIFSLMEALAFSDRINASMKNPPKGAPRGFIEFMEDLSPKARNVLNLWAVTLGAEISDDNSGDEESPIQLWNEFFVAKSTTPEKSQKNCHSYISTPKFTTIANHSVDSSFRTPELPKSARRKSIGKPAFSLMDDLAMSPSPIHLKGRVSQLRKSFEEDMRTPVGRSSKVESGSLKKNYPSFLSDDLLLSPSPSPLRSKASVLNRSPELRQGTDSNSFKTPKKSTGSIKHLSLCSSPRASPRLLVKRESESVTPDSAKRRRIG